MKFTQLSDEGVHAISNPNFSLKYFTNFTLKTSNYILRRKKNACTYTQNFQPWSPAMPKIFITIAFARLMFVLYVHSPQLKCQMYYFFCVVVFLDIIFITSSIKWMIWNKYVRVRVRKHKYRTQTMPIIYSKRSYLGILCSWSKATVNVRLEHVHKHSQNYID